MKAVVAAFNQEEALVGAFSVITNLRMELFEALICSEEDVELRYKWGIQYLKQKTLPELVKNPVRAAVRQTINFYVKHSEVKNELLLLLWQRQKQQMQSILCEINKMENANTLSTNCAINCPLSFQGFLIFDIDTNSLFKNLQRLFY